MTPLSQKILQHFQVRKSRRQKSEFIQLLQAHFPGLTVEECGICKSRSLIIGDIEKAKVVLTAHYDTCARMLLPNFISPKRIPLSILYSILLIAPIFVLVYILNLLLNVLSDNYWLHYLTSLIAYGVLLALMIVGPANRHNANDNTSGVIVLCELLQSLPVDELRKVVFVYFDNEEVGLLGSAGFKKRHAKQMKDKLLINFDCVSDGDHFLLAASKDARAAFEPLLADCFAASDTGKHIHMEAAEKIYYPSDQAHFKNTVCIAAMRYNKFLGHYISRIHTSADRVFDVENIHIICEGIRNFIARLK